MSKICVLQHHPDEGLGSLELILREYSHMPEIRHLNVGDQVPATTTGFDALVLMGGPMSVNDEADYPWLLEEKALIRAAAAAGLPILGHCLGAQLITAALGGVVAPNPVGHELGWWPVCITAAGRIFWPEIKDSFELFHWHGEYCSVLPAGAELLLSNVATPVQGFSIGPTILALQAHPEVTAPQVVRWLETAGTEIPATPHVQPAAAMVKGLSERCGQLVGLAEQLYRPWLKQLER